MNNIIKKASFIRLGKNSKVPIVLSRNWQNIYTSYEEIKDYNENLGIATGQISGGIYIIDLDFRKGKKESFDIVYDEYKEKFSNLSNTRIISSPNGFHFYYLMKNANYPNSSLKNGGYSDTLKSFNGSHSTRFGNLLKGIDTRGDGGYIVSENSKVDNKEYKVFNDVDPIEISKEDYKSIIDFFEEKDTMTHTMRRAFIDIATGKLNPQEYKQEIQNGENQVEHVIWKEFYHEAYSCLRLYPEDFLDGLECNNKGFDRQKTITQLNNQKNRTYILNGKRMTKEKYKKYFPKYSNNFDSYSRKSKDVDELLKTITKDSTNDEIGNLLALIPEKDRKKKNDMILEIKKITKMGKIDLKAIYKDYRLKKKEKEERITVDLFQQEKIDVLNSFEDEDGTFNNQECELNQENNGFLQTIDKDGNELIKLVKILPYPLVMNDKMKYNRINFYSFEFGDSFFNSESRSDMLNYLSKNYLYKGLWGEDKVKKLITHQENKRKYVDVENITGFNNNWILPELQEEKNYRIFITTDKQKESYDYFKHLINKEYSINDIKKKIKVFLKKTKIKKSKMAMIIGWCFASIFRLSFIRHDGFAPDLLLTGDPQTGKTAFSKAILVNLIGTNKKICQGSEISSLSRFEDWCTVSTFPMLVDEIESVNDNVISAMKARATDIPNFTRKTSAKEMFSIPEVGGFLYTSNTIPKNFNSSGLTDRLLAIEFHSSEIIEEEQEWNELSRELKKLNFFSYFYHYTKNWNDKKIFGIIDTIRNHCPIFLTTDRERKKYIFTFFGLQLFYLLTDIGLTMNLDERLFEESSKIPTGDVLNDFISLCNMAINYDLGSTNQNGTFIKGDNPKFLTKPLKANSNDEYIFISPNLRDFKEYVREDKYNLRNLSQEVNRAINQKDYFCYGSYSLDGIRQTAIKIPASFNEDVRKFRKNDV